MTGGTIPLVGGNRLALIAEPVPAPFPTKEVNTAIICVSMAAFVAPAVRFELPWP